MYHEFYSQCNSTQVIFLMPTHFSWKWESSKLWIPAAFGFSAARHAPRPTVTLPCMAESRARCMDILGRGCFILNSESPSRDTPSPHTQRGPRLPASGSLVPGRALNWEALSFTAAGWPGYPSSPPWQACLLEG